MKIHSDEAMATRATNASFNRSGAIFLVVVVVAMSDLAGWEPLLKFSFFALLIGVVLPAYAKKGVVAASDLADSNKL